MSKKSSFSGIYFGQEHVKTFGKIMKIFAEECNLSRNIQLKKYAEEGLQALKSMTPKDTGKTAESWEYRYVEKEKGVLSIEYYNTNNNEGQNVAILIQYGHMTKNGYYVRGLDYINPALNPVFDKIAESIYKEVRT